MDKLSLNLCRNSISWNWTVTNPLAFQIWIDWEYICFESSSYYWNWKYLSIFKNCFEIDFSAVNLLFFKVINQKKNEEKLCELRSNKFYIIELCKKWILILFIINTLFVTN